MGDGGNLAREKAYDADRLVRFPLPPTSIRPECSAGGLHTTHRKALKMLEWTVCGVCRKRANIKRFVSSGLTCAEFVECISD
jgi:hypothetical protein